MTWKSRTVMASTLLLMGGLYVYPQWQTRQGARISHCHDGDTCRVSLNGALAFNVRLVGIDAPEMPGRGGPGQPMAAEARDYLLTLVQSRPVELRQTDLDQYNRPIVEIFAGGQSVNRQLIRQGFAERYRGRMPKGLNQAAFAAAEAEAKLQGRGIWALPNYQSPQLYRRQHKKTSTRRVRTVSR